MSQLHPIFAQALRPWMPVAAVIADEDQLPAPTLAEIDEQRRRSDRRAELMDEYRTGLDQTGPQWEREEAYWRDEMLQGDD